MILELDAERDRFILRDKKIHHLFSRRKYTVENLLEMTYNPVKKIDIELDFIKGNNQLIYFKIDGLGELSVNSKSKISAFLRNNINLLIDLFNKDVDYWYSKFIND